jgi:hypothetical protein
MTSDEIERLRSHVAKVKKWRKAKEAARLGPDKTDPDNDYAKYQEWLAKNRKPDPNLTPSDLVFNLSRFESLLDKTPLGQATLKSYNEGRWADRYRKVYKKLRRLGGLVPSIKTDPQLQRLVAPTAMQAYDGLAIIEDWCRDAVEAMNNPKSHRGGSLPADAHDVYMPVSWFKDEFGISPERLRAARRRGDLPSINVSKSNRQKYHYSAVKAQELWPDDVEYLPELARPSG